MKANIDVEVGRESSCLLASLITISSLLKEETFFPELGKEGREEFVKIIDDFTKRLSLKVIAVVPKEILDLALKMYGEDISIKDLAIENLGNKDVGNKDLGKSTPGEPNPWN
jgi:hypothetical protein